MKLHWIAILVAVAVALALRLPQLERRPLHTDEAVHAVRLGDLLERGSYDYNPHDYHGPTMYYATVPIVWLRGEHTLVQLTATTMRLVPLVFGIGLILLLLAAGNTLGKTEAACAALLTAVSPFMVYFSRYYIMEVLFVFFTFGLLISAWRYWQTGKLLWAALAGVSMGLMHATKETCIITWFSLAVAFAVLWLTEPTRPKPQPLHLLVLVLFAGAVSVVCFSVFFTDWRGVPQSVLTYLNYAQRGQGSGHQHPWYYYLEVFAWHRTGKLLWTEGAILALAIIGSVRAFRERLAFGKLLTVYVAVMAAVYFVIPYKTPWSMLSLIHGLILLAGVGAAGLVKWVPWAAWPVLALAGAHLAFQSVRGNSARFECDERNPCVYSHTSRDAIRLVERVHQIAAVNPDGHQMLVKVMAKEYWPLPWYLRDLPNVGYWDKPTDPTGAAIIISSPEFNIDFGDGWQTEFFGLRPGVLLQVHIRRDLWQKFLETRSGARVAEKMVELKLEYPKPVRIGQAPPVKLPNLEPPNTPPPRIMVPEATRNVAKGKKVTSSDSAPVMGELEMITDGNKEAADGSYVELGPGLQWVQIDLGTKHTIYAVAVWHFHQPEHAYRAVIVQVSDNPDFVTGVKTIYNSDCDNSAGFGFGSDKTYVETHKGRLIDAKGVTGRYVRLYSMGSTATIMNHYGEVEVYGTPETKK